MLQATCCHWACPSPSRSVPLTAEKVLHLIPQDVVAPGRMRRRIHNPRILLLDCPLEYKKGENQTNVELTREEDWCATAGILLCLVCCMRRGNNLNLKRLMPPLFRQCAVLKHLHFLLSTEHAVSVFVTKAHNLRGFTRPYVAYSGYCQVWTRP